MRRVLGVGAFIAVTLTSAVLTAAAMQWAGDTSDPVLPGPVVLEPAATLPVPSPGPAVTPDPIEVRPAPERLEGVAPPGSASTATTAGAAPTPALPPSTGGDDAGDDDAGADDAGADDAGDDEPADGDGG